jgi:hypothetical protein
MPFLFFVDANENLVMPDGVATPSNPLVAPVEQEELEEVPFEMNVFQRLREDVSHTDTTMCRSLSF